MTRYIVVVNVNGTVFMEEVEEKKERTNEEVLQDAFTWIDSYSAIMVSGSLVFSRHITEIYIEER
jgi:hypothetical protein